MFTTWIDLFLPPKPQGAYSDPELVKRIASKLANPDEFLRATGNEHLIEDDEHDDNGST